MDIHTEHIEKSTLHKTITFTLIMAMIALGAYTYLTIKKAQYISLTEASISVSGEGEVIARPDIAVFSFGVLAEGDDAGSAQEESARAINAIMEYLTQEGIEANDIKTQNYNLSPRYDYVRSVCTTEGFCPPGKQVLRGYEVHQTIEVKVRAIETAGTLISGVGILGATNISNLQFTIDDEEEFIDEAREKAIADATEKAEKLAGDLGVKLIRVTHFWEENGGRGGEVYYERAMNVMGDDAMEMATAPSIPTGENTFTSRVNITYEVR